MKTISTNSALLPPLTPSDLVSANKKTAPFLSHVDNVAGVPENNILYATAMWSYCKTNRHYYLVAGGGGMGSLLHTRCRRKEKYCLSGECVLLSQVRSHHQHRRTVISSLASRGLQQAHHHHHHGRHHQQFPHPP